MFQLTSSNSVIVPPFCAGILICTAYTWPRYLLHSFILSASDSESMPTWKNRTAAQTQVWALRLRRNGCSLLFISLNKHKTGGGNSWHGELSSQECTFAPGLKRTVLARHQGLWEWTSWALYQVGVQDKASSYQRRLRIRNVKLRSLFNISYGLLFDWVFLSVLWCCGWQRGMKGIPVTSNIISAKSQGFWKGFYKKKILGSRYTRKRLTA